MLLDYIGWSEAAQLITAAIEKTFQEGIFTADLAFEKTAFQQVILVKTSLNRI